uniref:Col_cuticle_N domain-containing protein n=1 Tax=Steinernema glaseri TaxID=37863 RepID=A0A1I8AL00_9BILA
MMHPVCKGRTLGAVYPCRLLEVTYRPETAKVRRPRRQREITLPVVLSAIIILLLFVGFTIILGVSAVKDYFSSDGANSTDDSST